MKDSKKISIEMPIGLNVLVDSIKISTSPKLADIIRIMLWITLIFSRIRSGKNTEYDILMSLYTEMKFPV